MIKRIPLRNGMVLEIDDYFGFTLWDKDGKDSRWLIDASCFCNDGKLRIQNGRHSSTTKIRQISKSYPKEFLFESK